MKKRKVIIRTWCYCLLMIVGCSSCTEKSFHPGAIMPDNNGVHLNAHGAGFLYQDGVYYMYGEHKVAGKAGNNAEVGVHCYSSTNLYNWKDEGIALAVSEDENSPITKGCIIERPKVIYNRSTHKYVMWFHLELKGQGYAAAHTAVAISDEPCGPFVFIRSDRIHRQRWPLNAPEELKIEKQTMPYQVWSKEWKEAGKQGLIMQTDYSKGQTSRDMTLFVDDDGKAYHITSSEGNATLYITLLSDDYLSLTDQYVRVFPGEFNEAPAVFKHNDLYYLIASGCTGWRPNAARSAVADDIMGEWTYLGNPCRGDSVTCSTTFESQSTYILPVEGMKDAFIYIGDRWCPDNAIDGRYVFLPIEWEDNKPTISWYDEWNLSIFK